MKLYSTYSIEENITHHWKADYMQLWIKKLPTEWLIAFTHDKKKETSSIFEKSEKPDDYEWIRIISQKNSDMLVFKPSMPDKPVILQSPQEIRVLEKQKSVITVNIPLNLRIYSVTEKEEQLLFELPTEIMSKTWFGELLNGMLAYSLNTDIAVENSSLISENHALCKITVNNISKIPFRFRKLTIPVNIMNIYNNSDNPDNCYFTDSVLIEFADEEKLKITIDDYFFRSNKKKLVFEAQKSFQDKYIIFKGVTAFIKTVTGI